MLHQLFGGFDLDNSGFIERHELQQLGEVRRQLGQKSGSWTPGIEYTPCSVVDVLVWMLHCTVVVPGYMPCTVVDAYLLR